jgi:hypothetical protein
MHSTAAVTVGSPRATVSGIRIDNYGDGVRFLRKATDFTIEGAHFQYIRDDCVENDWLHGGAVKDTLLDGCYSAFSSRPYRGQGDRLSGRDNVVSITNTLVRLQPMDRVYRNRGVIPGHDGFFKWHKGSPRLTLQDNVFRADQRANNVGLAVPSDKVISCSNNVMVWLGPGPYPATLPSCFRITTDKKVWDRAVEDWKRRHGHPL